MNVKGLPLFTGLRPTVVKEGECGRGGGGGGGPAARERRVHPRGFPSADYLKSFGELQ